MGCDIHVFIEYSRDSGKTWQADPGHHVDREEEYVNSVDACGRNYALFGWLAGVRGRDNPLYPSATLPKNLSPEVAAAIDYWSEDGHSHSCLSLDEFTECVKYAYDDGGAIATHFTKCLKDAEPVAFFDWQLRNHNDYGPSYINLIKYCGHKLIDIAAEHMLLGDPNIPQCRLVFFFDN